MVEIHKMYKLRSWSNLLAKLVHLLILQLMHLMNCVILMCCAIVSANFFSTLNISRQTKYFLN